MNFKSIGFKAVIATAVVASSAVAISPAQAGDIRNKTLSFNGTSVLLQSNNIFNFSQKLDSSSGPDDNNYTTPIGIGTLADNSDRAFGTGNPIFKDLRLKKESATTWSLLGAVGAGNGDVINFISGLSSGITYSLKSFILTKQVDNSFKAVLDGFFNPGNIGDVNNSENSIIAKASLTTFTFSTINHKKTNRLLDTSGSPFSGTITAVPTPVLLPGLLSLGVAALRKRKSEESDVEAAETAKA